jgi:hypothetical protein
MTTNDQLVKRYIQLRDKKEEMNKLLKDRLQPIAKEMDEIETQLKTFLDDNKMDSAKTEAGTFFKKTNTYVTVRDMEEVLTFVKENDAFELFEKKVNKTVVLDCLKEGLAVPGVEVQTEIVVQIRR